MKFSILAILFFHACSLFGQVITIDDLKLITHNNSDFMVKTLAAKDFKLQEGQGFQDHPTEKSKQFQIISLNSNPGCLEHQDYDCDYTIVKTTIWLNKSDGVIQNPEFVQLSTSDPIIYQNFLKKVKDLKMIRGEDTVSQWGMAQIVFEDPNY